MSKINIPTCRLPDPECDTLFQSVADKLNIQNPRFHYPIYNKIIDNASESRGLIFDSKFKVREILSKVLDTDSDDYETDDACDDVAHISPNLGGDLFEQIDLSAVNDQADDVVRIAVCTSIISVCR